MFESITRSFLKGRHIIALIFWLAMSAGIGYWINQIQSPVDYSICPSCDGNQYTNIYLFFKEGTKSGIHSPFQSRIFQPALASVVHGTTMIGDFKLVNLLFAALTVILLFLIWKKLNFNPLLIGFGLFWMLFHWSGILRYYAFDPVSVDVPVYFFHALLLFIVLTKKYKWLWIIAPLALTTKESFLAYMVILVVYGTIHNWLFEKYFPMKTLWLALGLTIGTNIMLMFWFPALEEGRNAIRSLLYYSRGILQNPLELFRWVIALFTAFGGLFLLSLTNIRKHFKSNAEQSVILLFTAASILFGLIAGGDRTRILFVGFPFIMTSIFYLVQDRGVGVTLTAMVLSVPLMRVASKIPAIDAIGYKNWYPEFADLSVVCAWAFYMVFCYFMIKKADQYFTR